MALAVVVTVVTGVDYVAQARRIIGPNARRSNRRLPPGRSGDLLRTEHRCLGARRRRAVDATPSIRTALGSAAGSPRRVFRSARPPLLPTTLTLSCGPSSSLAAARAVLVTGGLGPTPDDVTRAALARLPGHWVNAELANDVGIEPGARLESSRAVVYAVPGVPAGVRDGQRAGAG